MGGDEDYVNTSQSATLQHKLFPGSSSQSTCEEIIGIWASMNTEAASGRQATYAMHVTCICRAYTERAYCKYVLYVYCTHLSRPIGYSRKQDFIRMRTSNSIDIEMETASRFASSRLKGVLLQR